MAFMAYWWMVTAYSDLARVSCHAGQAGDIASGDFAAHCRGLPWAGVSRYLARLSGESRC